MKINYERLTCSLRKWMRLKDIKVDSNNAVEGGNNIVDIWLIVYVRQIFLLLKLLWRRNVTVITNHYYCDHTFCTVMSLRVCDRAFWLIRKSCISYGIFR